MPTFDDTALNLALAGDRSGFHNEIGGGWPEALFEVLGALVELQDSKAVGTSGSSVSIGTGTKIFTLDVPRSWTEGTPVYIMEDGSPSSNFMVGKLSADEASGGVITVDVTGATGSGTFTAWKILSILAVTSVVSPPLAIADGGTGASTAPTAVASLGIARVRYVHERGPKPSNPIRSNLFYLVGPTGTDDFAGHDNEWATTPDGGSNWFFESPAANDVALINLDQEYTSGTAGRHTVSAFHLGAWVDIVWPRDEGSTFTMGQNLSGPGNARTTVVWRKTGTNSPTFTLPTSWTSTPLIIGNDGASGDVTVNVASGGTVDGGASVTVAAGSAKQFLFLSTGKWCTI